MAPPPHQVLSLSGVLAIPRPHPRPWHPSRSPRRRNCNPAQPSPSTLHSPLSPGSPPAALGSPSLGGQNTDFPASSVPGSGTHRLEPEGLPGRPHPALPPSREHHPSSLNIPGFPRRAAPLRLSLHLPLPAVPSHTASPRGPASLSWPQGLRQQLTASHRLAGHREGSMLTSLVLPPVSCTPGRCVLPMLLRIRTVMRLSVAGECGEGRVSF